MTAPDPRTGPLVPVPHPEGGPAVPRAALERVLARAAELQQAAVTPDGQETVPEGVLLEIALAGVPMVLLGRGGIPEMIQGPDGLMAFMIDDAQDDRLPGNLVAAIARARAQPGKARAQAAARPRPHAPSRRTVPSRSPGSQKSPSTPHRRFTSGSV